MRSKHSLYTDQSDAPTSAAVCAQGSPWSSDVVPRIACLERMPRPSPPASARFVVCWSLFCIHCCATPTSGCRQCVSSHVDVPGQILRRCEPQTRRADGTKEFSVTWVGWRGCMRAALHQTRLTDFRLPGQLIDFQGSIIACSVTASTKASKCCKSLYVRLSFVAQQRALAVLVHQ
jgi:hypothetical protein